MERWAHSPVQRNRSSATTGSVLLWADTFNNHFLPSTAKAAAEVLEAAGFDVRVPHAHLCCGRPLYDVGMLDRAKSLLLQIMDELFLKSKQQRPSLYSNPAAPPSSVMNSPIFSRKTSVRKLSRNKFSCLVNFLSSTPKISRFPSYRAGRSSTAIAITRPS